MDTNLLRFWLELPPGEWPPEPEILLGTSANVQDRALALMEKLRPYQLRHPELVTEGMNRLAQALIAIERKSMAATKSVVNIEKPNRPPDPVILDAEVITASSERETPRRRKRRRKATADRVAVPILETPKPATLIADRRKAYSRLVRIGRVARAWERLGPFYGVPSHSLLTSADVFRYLEATNENRDCISRLAEWPMTQGILTRAIVFHQASLALFRDLRKKQRIALAADWATALGALQAEERMQRSLLRQSMPHGSMRQRYRAARRWLKAHPETLLVLILGLAFLIAITRWMTQRN